MSLAPVTEGLVGSLGFRGAFLILAAIVLSNILFGALFQPLDTGNAVSTCSTTTGPDQDLDDPMLEKKNSGIFPTPSNNDSFASGDNVVPGVPPVSGVIF